MNTSFLDFKCSTIMDTQSQFFPTTSIGIRKTKVRLEAIGIKTSRMNKFAKLVNRPMWLLVATARINIENRTRKRRWYENVVHVVKHSKASNLAKSFYVGDSAGRQGVIPIVTNFASVWCDTPQRNFRYVVLECSVVRCRVDNL